MPLFPPAAPVGVFIDGHRLPAYVAARLERGRVVAPVRPLFTVVADRLWREGRAIVIQRDGHIVRIQLPQRGQELEIAGVPVAAPLRQLGARVAFDAATRVLRVRFPSRGPAASPTPFAGQTVPPPAQPVFTPEPIVTPRPVWSGPALPRRTPLPAGAPAQPPPRRRMLRR